MSSNIEIKKTGLWCGREFIACKTSTEYCSHRCSGLAYKERKRQAKLEAYKPGTCRKKWLRSLDFVNATGLCILKDKMLTANDITIGIWSRGMQILPVA